MILRKISLVLSIVALISCNTNKKEQTATTSDSTVRIVGAMKNVMWKGELGSSLDLDTISNKKGLYGLGPHSYLTGELLINNGNSYISKVTSDTTMVVEKRFDVSAPFFVYANVSEWNTIPLEPSIKNSKDLEAFLDEETKQLKRPFAFKLTGKIAKAAIHIRNLPKGTPVSSHKEAHQGQVNYHLKEEQVTIIGFFSTEHKGVFTHHDSNIHMHLITNDERKMGHLDELEIGNMKLYLPKK